MSTDGKNKVDDQSNNWKRTGSAILDATQYLTQYGNELKKLANPLQYLQDIVNLEDSVTSSIRSSMGLTRDVSELLLDNMAEIGLELGKYNIDNSRALTIFENINDVLKRNTYLTNEQSVSLLVLAKNADLTEMEIAQMVESFDTLGYGINDSIEMMSDMQKQARLNGLNVNEYMKEASKNMKTLNSYNFKDGVEGFTRMVTKAQELRIDFGQTIKFAEDLMDPQKAIETAAGFQMLGGAIGDLGDPFKLLYMAQNDVEGLQDAMIDMTKSVVTFNEETGQFDIPVTEMYKLREVAKLTGKSYQDLADEAIKAASKSKKLEFLDMNANFSDDEKNLISNLAKFEGGELMVTLPGQDEAISVAELTPEKIEELRKQQQIAMLSEREIAEKQLSTLDQMNANLETIKNIRIAIGANTPALIDFNELFGAAAKTSMNILTESFNKENITELSSSLSGWLASGLSNDDAKNNFIDAGLKIKNEIVTGLIDSMGSDGTLSRTLSDDNVLNTPIFWEGLKDTFNELILSIEGLGDIITNPDFDPTTSSSVITTPTMISEASTGQQINTTPTSVENTQQISFDTLPINVGGKVELSMTNLNNLIKTDILGSELLKNQDFINKIRNILTDATGYATNQQ